MKRLYLDGYNQIDWSKVARGALRDYQEWDRQEVGDILSEEPTDWDECMKMDEFRELEINESGILWL